MEFGGEKTGFQNVLFKEVDVLIRTLIWKGQNYETLSKNVRKLPKIFFKVFWKIIKYVELGKLDQKSFFYNVFYI